MGWGRRLVLAWACAAGLGCVMRKPAPAPLPAAVPDDLSKILTEGTPAPDVAALDHKEKPQSLARYRGQYLVLYFYPMDFAAGASAQAKEFRADLAKYGRYNARIVGISTDEPHIHRDFAAKYKVPYPLLSDPKGEVARAFGVPLQAGTIRHATFLIDRHGVIRKVWPKVQPWGHSREVLEALKGLTR
jgi:thioredoxin-dependent peroxiredoxin